MPTEVPLLYRIVLANLVFVVVVVVVAVFPYKVDYCSLRVFEEFFWDFDGNCIEFIDCHQYNCHFYCVDLTHPRAWEILPFSGVLFNFFLQSFKFLSNRSFISLVSVTPRYLKLFVAIVKGEVSLLSLTASLSFVYRKATDFFFRLILYSATSLKVFIYQL